MKKWNGSVGIGEWFYKRWSKAVDSDELFTTDVNTGKEIFNKDIDIESKVADSSKNRFVRIKYHWKEDSRKDDAWYQKQVQELDDERKVNQELDLAFIATTNCIFSDRTLKLITPISPVREIITPNGAFIKVFEQNINPLDYYIIGCDTAQALESAYCAIQVYSFKDFNQIAEVEYRYGSYSAFGKDIHFVFQWLYSQVRERIILAIENNTIGQSPIEELVLHTPEFYYEPYLYKEIDKHEFGIKTTSLTKPLMAGFILQAINENPSGIRSQDLKNQCSSVERTQGGSITSKTWYDLFMASCFCAYVRNKKALEILPLVQHSPEEVQKMRFSDMRNMFDISNPHKYSSINPKQMLSSGQVMTLQQDDNLNSLYLDDDNFGNDGDIGFFPIFGG